MPLRPYQDDRRHLGKGSPPGASRRRPLWIPAVALLWIALAATHVLSDDGTERWIWLGLGVLWIAGSVRVAWELWRDRHST